MTAVATNGIKVSMGKPSRGCFGPGMDFFKGDDHSNMIKYKSIAEAETARADANAEEITVLRDMLSKVETGADTKSLIEDSDLRMKNAELTAKVEEQEEDIKKLKEALGVASTALESEESAKVASRVTASAAMDDLKAQIETLKTEKEAAQAQNEALKAEKEALEAQREALKAEKEASEAEKEAAKAEATNSMSQEQQTTEARQKVEALLAKQALLFDGAGNKNTQNSPLGVPQSWKLESLDAKKKASNMKTMETLYDILKQYPDLYVQCHGETDADASKPADAVLAKYFGFNTMQPIQDRLAENRATAVQDALVSHGIPAERVVVTYKGCGGASKVDIIPMPAAQALQKMRGNMMRRHTLDLQKISQMEELEKDLQKTKDDLAAEQAKSKAEATSAPAVVDTAALDAKQAELDAEKAKTAALEADLAASRKAEAESAAAAAAAATAAAAAASTAAADAAAAAANAKAEADAEKAKEAASQAEAVKAEAEKAAASAKAEEEKAAKAAAEAAAAKEAAAPKAPPPGMPPSATTAASAPAEVDMQAPGVLRVKVISATGLLAGDASGFSDPYAKVHLGGVVHKTHVKKKTLDPEWDEQFDFHGTLAEMVAAPLEVVLNDQDTGGLSKTSLGSVSLSFGAEVLDGKAMEGALSTQGSVKLFVSFAPYKLVLKNSMYVKKRGISGGRYTEHECTLSLAQGFDGWTSYRLAYRDAQGAEHAATVIGMSDNAPMRYEYTIVTHENQGYSIRNGTSDEYKQWTEVLKQIVPPPLSRGHAEEAVEGEVKAKKKSIFSRVGGKKTSVTE